MIEEYKTKSKELKNMNVKVDLSDTINQFKELAKQLEQKAEKLHEEYPRMFGGKK